MESAAWHKEIAMVFAEGRRSIEARELATLATLQRRRAQRLAVDIGRYVKWVQELNGALREFEIYDGAAEPRAQKAALDLVDALRDLESQSKTSVISVDMEVTGETPAELEA